METPDSSISSSARAAQLFGEYLRLSAGEGVDFEAFCGKHPEEAADLRRYLERWQSAESSSGPSTLRPIEASDGPGPAVLTEASSVFERLVEKGPTDRRYRVEGELARGGMGVIQNVWDRELRRSIAMKVILEDDAAGGSADSTFERRLARFLEEAQVTGQLEHPGVVPVHELGLDAQGRAFFTMQRVRGRDLKEVFELVRNAREDWSVTRALGVLLRVCEAMAFAHEKGVVHRDLKPANIMVGRFGETYVMDWGLAKVLGREDSRDVRPRVPAESAEAPSIVRTDRAELEPSASSVVTLDGDILGTPCYMSPEQAKGRLEDIGPRTDIYSVGCMLYHLLTGQMPYVAAGEKASPVEVLRGLIEGPPTPVAQLAKDVPAELVAICEKAMERQVAERYETMLEMASDLRAFLENRVVSAYRTGAVQEFRKWIERNRAIAATAAAAIVLTIAGLGSAAWIQVSANRDLEQANVDIARARDEAVENKRNAERLSYAANLAANQASLTFYHAEDARRRLDACAEDLRGWEWHRCQQLADSSLVAIEVEGSTARAVAFHPGGGRVIASCDDGKLREYDAGTGALLGEYIGHEKPVNSVAYDATGSRLASASGDRTVRIWDTGSRATTLVLTGHKGPVASVAWHPDGERLASSTWEKIVRIWDARTGEEIAELEGHKSSINGCRFSADGALLITASSDRSVRTWDVANGEPLATFRGSDLSIASADISPNAIWIAAGANRNSLRDEEELDPQTLAVRVWRNGSDADPALLIGHEGGVTAVAFAPTGERLASASVDRSVRLWDLLAGTETVLLGHSKEVTSLAWDPSGKRIATASRDGSVRIWAADGIAQDVYSGHLAAVRSVAFTADGKRFFSVSDDATSRLWNTDSGRVELIRAPLGLRRPGPGTTVSNELRQIALSPDGTWAAIAGKSGVARWDLDDYSAKHVPTDVGACRTVAIDPTGQWLVTGGDRGVLYRLDPELDQIAAYEGHEGMILSAVIARSGTWLASGSFDKTLRVWDTQTGECIQRFEGDSFGAAMALSEDGLLLAAGGETGRIAVWNTATWEKIATCESRRAACRSTTLRRRLPTVGRQARGWLACRVRRAYAGRRKTLRRPTCKRTVRGGSFDRGGSS